jgi:hypothetical protein
MPEVRIVVDRSPLPHAGEEGVHHDELRHLGGKLRGVGIGDHQADVMPHDRRLLDAQRADEAMDAAGSGLHVEPACGDRRIPDTGQIRRDHRELPGEGRNHHFPHPRGLGVAVRAVRAGDAAIPVPAASAKPRSPRSRRIPKVAQRTFMPSPSCLRCQARIVSDDRRRGSPQEQATGRPRRSQRSRRRRRSAGADRTTYSFPVWACSGSGSTCRAVRSQKRTEEAAAIPIDLFRHSMSLRSLQRRYLRKPRTSRAISSAAVSSAK